MMDRVLSDMVLTGYTKIMLWVFKENITARRSYDTNGFITNEKHKHGIYPIEICYERSISP